MCSTPSRSVPACTLAIETGAVVDQDLGIAYGNRGLSLYNKGDFLGCIQDLDKAIQLGPDQAIAYHGRGAAYYHRAAAAKYPIYYDYTHAIADLSKSI